MAFLHESTKFLPIFTGSSILSMFEEKNTEDVWFVLALPSRDGRPCHFAGRSENHKMEMFIPTFVGCPLVLEASYAMV